MVQPYSIVVGPQHLEVDRYLELQPYMSTEETSSSVITAMVANFVNVVGR